MTCVAAAAQPQQPPLPEIKATPQTTAAKSALQYAGKPLKLEYACTNDDILAAGLNCTADEPCPLLLELSGVEAVGNRLFAVGNVHTQTSTVASVLLASDDGRTWTEPHERIRTGALDQVQFFDFESGWVSGQLVISNTPRDPFFLLTTDGGKTWRRRALWEESRPGLIEGFWFDSKRHGMLALDRMQAGDDESRYALYESQTGGESWTIRQASTRRLTVERKVPDTGLRVRADGPSKSYRIERKQGERWVVVSAFALDAGVCRMQEAPLVEREPPPEQTREEPPVAPAAKPPSLRKKK